DTVLAVRRWPGHEPSAALSGPGSWVVDRKVRLHWFCFVDDFYAPEPSLAFAIAFHAVPLADTENLKHQPFELSLDLSYRQRLPPMFRTVGGVRLNQLARRNVSVAIHTDARLEEMS